MDSSNFGLWVCLVSYASSVYVLQKKITHHMPFDTHIHTKRMLHNNWYMQRNVGFYNSHLNHQCQHFMNSCALASWFDFFTIKNVGPTTTRCTKIASHVDTLFSKVLDTPLNSYHVFILNFIYISNHDLAQV